MHRRTNKPSPFRRTKAVAAGGLLMLAALAVLPMPRSGAETEPAAAAAAVEPGQGTSIGQTWKIDPKAAGLSIGITFGQALAGHQNKVAKAASQAINLGVIGTTMGGAPCDPSEEEPTWPRDKQPQPLTVDSREEGAADGKSEYEDHIHDSPKFGYGPWRKQVKANDTPFGEAVTTTGPIGIQGVLEIGAGVARSFSGVVDGARVAQATVDIDHINLATVVKLGGIRWEATYNSSAAEDGVSGRFTIGHAVIGGTSSPTHDPSKAIDEANKALLPFGLKVTPPKAYQAGGVLFVQPLTIGVVPNKDRDTTAGAVIKGIQPIREPLFEEMIKADCDAADLITIFDIAVGSITGAGEFAIELGGVQATSGDIPDPGYDLSGGGFVFDPGIPGVPGIEGSFVPGVTSAGGTAYSGAPTPTARAATTRQSNPQRAAETFTPAASFKGTRGGAMAGVGLATLALLVLFAEADRRKMRRAQRQILTTEE